MDILPKIVIMSKNGLPRIVGYKNTIKEIIDIVNTLPRELRVLCKFTKVSENTTTPVRVDRLCELSNDVSVYQEFDTVGIFCQSSLLLVSLLIKCGYVEYSKGDIQYEVTHYAKKDDVVILL